MGSLRFEPLFKLAVGRATDKHAGPKDISLGHPMLPTMGMNRWMGSWGAQPGEPCCLSVVCALIVMMA